MINPNFEPFEGDDMFFDNFWSISGQFENGKKSKISTSTILTVFQLKKLKKILHFFSKKNAKNLPFRNFY